MRFARLVERGNRQILLTTDRLPDEDNFNVRIETHYVEGRFISIAAGDYATQKEAYDNMMSLTDDKIVSIIATVIDGIDEQ